MESADSRSLFMRNNRKGIQSNRVHEVMECAVS